ncbi:MAG: MBL fold metallo-hydrolase [Pseudomonadales bacterium]
MPQQLYQDLGSGITCIDTGLMFEGMAACYLLEHGGEVAIIETGINNTVPVIMGLLEIKGIALEQVVYVIPTHVHLDHAGGAGLLMQQLPNAQLVIHPLGARHMIDPAKLIAGTKAVYGEQAYIDMYGELLPIDESRVIQASDEMTLTVGGRELHFYDTPGHARHHFCIHDPLSEGIFTGDTFGISYQIFDGPDGRFIMPTTTPVQFDPQALKASIARLMSLSPQRMYLTHHGMVENPSELAAQLIEQIDDYVELAKKSSPGPDRIDRLTEVLKSYTAKRISEIGLDFTDEELDKWVSFDMKLNAQGLDVWLDRQ